MLEYIESVLRIENQQHCSHHCLFIDQTPRVNVDIALEGENELLFGTDFTLKIMLKW